MRLGIMAGASEGTGKGLKDIVSFAKTAEQRGFDSLWLANIFGVDAVGTMALAGWETQRIELGTAVTPTYPRHPTALAQQAITTSVACDGRFTLGIGLSHKLVIEDMLGLSYDKPASHMHEYLQVIGPLLRGEPAHFEGKEFKVHAGFDIQDAQAVPLLVAALGPRMLDIAGTYADGTVTWVTGPKTLEQHIVPGINKAANAAGKPTPRVVAGLPIAVTNNPDEARTIIAKELEMYGMLPSYRAMLDREGAAGPADIAIVGDESAVRAGLARLRDAGVTDFIAAIIPVGEHVVDNTLDLLESELA